LPFLGRPLPPDFSFNVMFLRAGLGLEVKEFSDSSSTSESETEHKYKLAFF